MLKMDANQGQTLRSLPRKAEKALFHLSQDFYRKKLIAEPPTHLQIEPTVRCNLHCTTCSREDVIGSYSKTSMSVADIQHILSLVPTLKTVKFQGLGEPLLTPHLDQILPLFQQRSIRLWTISNGTVLHDPKFRRYLLEYFKDATISIDSTDEENFRRIRIGGELNQIRENLRLLIAERNQINPNLSIGINFCITSENYHELASLEAFALSVPIDYISLVFMENWHTANESGHARASQEVRRTQAYRREIQQSILALKVKLLSRGILVGHKPSEPRLGNCFWPFRSFFINVEGEITPCCVRMHRQHSLGNILKVNSLNEIWNGPGYQALRQAHLKKDRSNPFCGTCPL